MAIEGFSKQERWVIYSLFRDINGEMVDELKEQILWYYQDEWKDVYKKLNERRVIKELFDLFDLSFDIVYSLYDAIEEEKPVDIKLNNDKVLYGILPLTMYFDEETYEWYLRYEKRRKTHIIRIKKITKVYKSKNQIQNWQRDQDDNSSGTIVTIRIYNEKSSKDYGLRYIWNKKIHRKTINEDYTEYEIEVDDLNIFRRWVRNMVPSVVVLEPVLLREQIKGEIDNWIDKLEI